MIGPGGLLNIVPAEDVQSLPQISVLMPVRDGARWISTAIESVLSQTFADFELIVVDDGSTDATPAIVAGHASRDPRIVVMTQPASGLVTALNSGLSAARAPLLARLDADDVAEPTRLAEQLAEMTRNPQLAVLGSWALEIDETGRAHGVRRPKTDADQLMRELNRANPMIHSAVMLRTAMAREAGGYRPTFTAAEDFDLWLRLSERGEVANLERELVRYRVHSGSITARKSLVQLLSTRLAQRSALLRRAGQPDPADGLKTPFDVWADPPPAYAEAVAIHRVLAWASPETIPAAYRNAPPDFGVLSRSKLSRRERSFAQKAILRYLADHPDAPRMALWSQLIGLRPFRAVLLIWRHLFVGGDGRSRS